MSGLLFRINIDNWLGGGGGDGNFFPNWLESCENRESRFEPVAIELKI